MPRTSYTTISITRNLYSAIVQNKYFFICFICFLITGGIILGSANQGDLLLYFSTHRNSSLDFFFKNATKLGEELSYIILLILFLFTRFRYAGLILLTGIIVTIISYMSKSFFLHPRPSVFYKNLGTLNEINLVEGVHIVGGLTSFPSGHTMAGFALFTLVALFVKNKNWLAILLFTSALMVGVSRVYLVQHFLKDIYLGAIIGVLIALLVYSIQGLFPINKEKWLDGSISFFL